MEPGMKPENAKNRVLQLAAQRKRNNDQVADLTLQLEQLQKSKVIFIPSCE